MQRLLIQIFLILLVVTHSLAQTDAVQRTIKIVHDIIEKSYPELISKKIEVKTFKSESDYFQSRFSFGRMLTVRKMHYIIFVNPKVFEKNAPEFGIRSIIAHELAHVLYYAQRNRFQLLGLMRLTSKGFTQQFERRADLTAIDRGYGKGLIEYRKWLYHNIPANKLVEKQRNYFSPEEITKILEILKQKPDKMVYWKKNVPLRLEEITP